MPLNTVWGRVNLFLIIPNTYGSLQQSYRGEESKVTKKLVEMGGTATITQYVDG